MLSAIDAHARDVYAGSTQAGAFGFAWHKVVLTTDGSSTTWDIDDSRIATVDVSQLVMGGNNIALGVSDVNTTTTRHPSLLFTVIDNLQVTDTPVVPEPATLLLMLPLESKITPRETGASSLEKVRISCAELLSKSWKLSFSNPVTKRFIGSVMVTGTSTRSTS